MSKIIHSCICLTCGVRNDHSHPSGLCQNGHDNWLEYRDMHPGNETCKAAIALTDLSFQELYAAFTNPEVKFIPIYHSVDEDAEELEHQGLPFNWNSIEINDWEVNYRMLRMEKHVICKICKKTAIAHPMEDRLLSNGEPWLFRMCNGIWAKL